MRAHVSYLAADALHGREAGTVDYDRAAAYVVEQFKAAGLQPGGEDGGWYQKVPLAVTRATGTPAMTLNDQPLAFNVDFDVSPTPGTPGLTLTAPVVFAGNGVVDAAIFYSGPKGLNSEVAAHLGNRVDRARVAAAHGAAGVLMIWTGQIEKVLPFDRAVKNWDAAPDDVDQCRRQPRSRRADGGSAESSRARPSCSRATTAGGMRSKQPRTPGGRFRPGSWQQRLPPASITRRPTS